jgi:putative oxidoreductase
VEALPLHETMEASMNPAKPGWSDDVGKLLLRLAVGGLLLFQGIHKLRFGLGPIVEVLHNNGLPAQLAPGVFVGELVAPLLILLGILTRPSALVLALTMLVAVALAWRDQVFQLTWYGGWAIELHVFYILGGLALCFLGSGRLGLSRGRGRWD